MLSTKFSKSYLTLLSSAIWNCRNENLDLGIVQLFGCIEKIPQDLVAGAELIKYLSIKKNIGLYSGVKNYVSSFALKTSLPQYMYSNFRVMRIDVLAL